MEKTGNNSTISAEVLDRLREEKKSANHSKENGCKKGREDALKMPYSLLRKIGNLPLDQRDKVIGIIHNNDFSLDFSEAEHELASDKDAFDEGYLVAVSAFWHDVSGKL
jgi:hypothetical protein